jgi:hypothetical protein
MSPNAKIAKRVAGCGKALPMRSIAERNRERIELRFAAVSFSFFGKEASVGLFADSATPLDSTLEGPFQRCIAMIHTEVHRMRRTTLPLVIALLSILLIASPGFTQETEPLEPEAVTEQEAHEDENAEAAKHEEHGESEGHGGRHLHKNDFAIFVGATDEHGHETELTLGLDYRRQVANRLFVGVLFDYAGGEMRNSVLAASLTWFPVGRLFVTAAPGIEFHEGRRPRPGCDCGGTLKSEEPGEFGFFDEDATYFLFRLGVGWQFPIGQNFGVAPNVNVDFVNNEKVLVYGFHFTYAW